MTGGRIPHNEWPVDATRVARRAFVLAAVVCSGAISDDAGQPEVQSLHDRVLGWLTHLSLWSDVEPSEERILRAPLGTLREQDTIQAVWYAEGLAGLAWALNLLELPKHDEQVDPPAVAEAVWFLSEDAGEVIGKARLRSFTEIEAGRELLYAIHCRLRHFARNGRPVDFTKWVEAAWLDTLKLDASHLIIHNDLAIGGRAISEVGEECRQECESITRERHRAMIWLTGEDPSYTQLTVDT